MKNRLRAIAITITSTGLMAFGAAIKVPEALAGCMPSDPFGHNRFNICPEGFAFSFTQNFDHLRRQLERCRLETELATRRDAEHKPKINVDEMAS